MFKNSFRGMREEPQTIKTKRNIKSIFKKSDDAGSKKKMRILTFVFWGALVITLCLSIYIGIDTKRTPEDKTRFLTEKILENKPSIGYLAPIIKGLYYDEKTLLYFFRLDSDASLLHLKMINELYAQTESQGIKLIGIVEGTTENALKEFMSNKNYEFDVILDQYSEMWDEFNVISIPMSFLIEKGGTISNIRVGTMSLADLIKFVKLMDETLLQ